MNFSINLGAWNSIFAVPCALVDQHIRLSGALQLKVLLWSLRHAGEPLTEETIAAALNANAADVRDAMQYWIECGLISQQGDHAPLAPGQASFPAPPADTKKEAEEQPSFQNAPAPSAPPRRIPKPDGAFLAQRISQSQEISFLMQESQQTLGRPLSPGLSSALLQLHDDYGLPADVILMLLQYVKSRGKDNTSYIESVGKNWAAEGIFSHELVEEKLRRLDEISSAWRKIEQTVGIDHRSPSSREEQYAARWLLEWNFDVKMVREAYERCVNATGKLSMSYMNRILERWHKEGISDPQHAALEKDKKPASGNGRQTTYDIDEYERMTMSIPDLPKE